MYSSKCITTVTSNKKLLVAMHLLLLFSLESPSAPKIPQLGSFASSSPRLERPSEPA